MKFQLVTAPVNLPLTLAEVKNHIKLDSDHTEDDAWIMGAIRAATQRCEDHTRRCLITQTWSIWFDRFMAGQEEWWDGVRQGSISELISCKRYLELRKAPVQSVSYLKTYDDTDTATTAATTVYMVDTVSVPARLALRNGQTWPTTILRPLNGIEIQTVCGYGANPGDVPQAIRQGMLNDIAHQFEHRGDAVDDNGQIIQSLGLSPMAASLYAPYVVRSL
jgi:hypothetical protein